MLPAERRDVGQEFARDLEPGLPPRVDGVAELQRVPVDDDRGQQVEAGNPVVLPLPGSVPQLAALMEVDGALDSPWKKSRRRSGPFRRLGDERLSRWELPAAN